MKRFIKTALTVVLAAAAVSCAKEIEPQKENINGTIDLTITGTINGYTPQEETKAEAQTVVRIMWKGDETVYVYDGTKNLGSLTASIEGTDGTYAKLSGTISATQATTLTFVYSPQFSEAPDVTEGGKISLNLSTQNGEEVPFLIYATLPTAQTQDPTSFTNEVVQFNLATSVFKCNCAGLGEDGEISQAAINGVNTKCELALSDNGAPEVSGTTLGTITRTAGFKADDQRAIFSVALPKTDESAQDRTIEVTKGRKKFTASYPKKAFDVSKSFNSVFAFEELVVIPTEALTAGVFSVSPTKKVYFSPGNLYAKKEGEVWSWHFYDEQYKYNSYQKDEWDNMIATADDNQIDLFTWGYGSWSTNPITEEYGSTFTDWGTLMGDDNTWYTLSSAEWQYLFSWDGTYGGELDWKPGVTDYTNETRKGLYALGVTVCGKTNCIILYPDGFAGTKVENGDTSSYDTEEEWTAAENAGVVCLPAAGLRNDGERIKHYGRNINYWSSTLYEDGCACGVITFNTDFNPDYGGLFCKQGCSVRLVTDAPELPEVPVESISLSETELELMEGLSESLTVTFTPEDATKKAVFWSSDNTAVATVDQTGKVSAVSVGTATITAVADGLAKDYCAVTVSGLPNNVIIYKAAEKLGEFDANDEDYTPGIDTDAFTGNSITSHTFNDGIGIITFENDVVSIGEEAFYGCAMTYIGIPASVKEIGYEAFYECEELEQVFIAGGSELETIGEEAFSYSALTSFNIPASVKEIGSSAFGLCTALEQVSIAGGSELETIGRYAFSRSAFTSFNIPASVTKIEYAFYQCMNLTTVSFANDCQLTEISKGAFAECGLRSITIPASVTKIGQAAFSSSALTSVNIPSSVTEIGESAFAACALASITIPSSVKVIGEYAFYGCEDLTTLTFADNIQLTEIGYRTFYQSGLTSINIPALVTEIGGEAFYECEDLTTVTFEDNSQLTKIGVRSFGSSGLTSINIPASVTEIGEAAFYGCNSLDVIKVNWPSAEEIPSIINKDVFDGVDPSNRKLYVPSGMVETYTNVDKGWNAPVLGTITDEND